MSFDTFGPGGLDYFPCRYGASKLLFRGPKRALDEPFIACLGGTNTYGKFVERPFPDLLEDALDFTCVNLGCMNAGIDVMLHDPFLRSVVSEAELTLVQIESPRNMSNRYYTVHPRRNDRFLKPSAILRSIYREVDFSEFNFTKHMLTRLHAISEDRFNSIISELQQAWSARMRTLLEGIPGKTALLWVSDHAPGEAKQEFGLDPWFVTRDMIRDIEQHASGYIEVVASPEAMSAGTEGMVFCEMEAPAAGHVLGPLVHREAAAALHPVVRDLLK